MLYIIAYIFDFKDTEFYSALPVPVVKETIYIYLFYYEPYLFGI